MARLCAPALKHRPRLPRPPPAWSTTMSRLAAVTLVLAPIEWFVILLLFGLVTDIHALTPAFYFALGTTPCLALFATLIHTGARPLQRVTFVLLLLTTPVVGALLLCAIARLGRPSNLIDHADSLETRQVIELRAPPHDKAQSPDEANQIRFDGVAFSVWCEAASKSPDSWLRCHVATSPPSNEDRWARYTQLPCARAARHLLAREGDRLRLSRDEKRGVWFVRAGDECLSHVDPDHNGKEAFAAIVREIRPPDAAVILALLGVACALRLVRRRHALARDFDRLTLVDATSDGNGAASIAGGQLARMPAPCPAGPCVVATTTTASASYRTDENPLVLDTVSGTLQTLKQLHDDRLHAHAVWALAALVLPSLPLSAWLFMVLQP